MVMCRDLTWHPGCRAQSDILQPAIYIYPHNWKLDPENPQRARHAEEWTNLWAPWHLSCTTFLGQLLFYPEGFVVWSPSRGLHKHILFPYTLLESLGWCWSRCHVDLLFSFAGMFSVWILYCFWHQGIWLGDSLDFCSVYLLSCQSYRVAQCMLQ